MTDKQFVAVAKLEELPPGKKRVVEVNGVEIVLCHTQGRVFAVRNLCSHAYEKLADGRIKDGWIACPVHGARFDLETGEPINPPAVMPVQVYDVRVEADVIEVAQ